MTTEMATEPVLAAMNSVAKSPETEDVAEIPDLTKVLQQDKEATVVKKKSSKTPGRKKAQTQAKTGKSKKL